MITVKIEYKCDKCGEIHKEKPIIKEKGYEDVCYFIENEDSAYMPEGWVDDGDLICSKCAKDDAEETDAIVIARA